MSQRPQLILSKNLMHTISTLWLLRVQRCHEEMVVQKWCENHKKSLKIPNCSGLIRYSTWIEIAQKTIKIKPILVTWLRTNHVQCLGQPWCGPEHRYYHKILLYIWKSRYQKSLTVERIIDVGPLFHRMAIFLLPVTAGHDYSIYYQ